MLPRCLIDLFSCKTFLLHHLLDVIIQQLETEGNKGATQFFHLLIGQTLREKFENFHLGRVKWRLQSRFHNCLILVGKYTYF